MSIKGKTPVCSDYWEAVITEAFRLSSRALGSVGRNSAERWARGSELLKVCLTPHITKKLLNIDFRPTVLKICLLDLSLHMIGLFLIPV